MVIFIHATLHKFLLYGILCVHLLYTIHFFHQPQPPFFRPKVSHRGSRGCTAPARFFARGGRRGGAGGVERKTGALVVFGPGRAENYGMKVIYEWR